MKKILCVCMSSTIQRTITFENLTLTKVNRSRHYRIDASGKAVNSARVLEQLEKQLNKIIPVIKVKRLEEGNFISRELTLIKVHCPAAKRAEIIQTVEIMQAKIVDVATNCVTIEYCECANRVNTLIDLLKPYGIREIVRTGTVAIDRGTASVSV